MIESVEELKKETGVLEACRVLGVPRSSIYRARKLKEELRPFPQER